MHSSEAFDDDDADRHDKIKNSPADSDNDDDDGEGNKKETFVSSLEIDEHGWVRNSWNYCPEGDQSSNNSNRDTVTSVLPYTKILQSLLTINYYPTQESKVEPNNNNNNNNIDEDKPLVLVQNMQRADGLIDALQKALDEIMNMKPKGKRTHVHPPYWKTQITLNSLQIFMTIMGRITFMKHHPDDDVEKEGDNEVIVDTNNSSNSKKSSNRPRRRKKCDSSIIFNQTHYDLCTVKQYKNLESNYIFTIRQHSSSTVKGDTISSINLNIQLPDIHRKIITASPTAVDETRDILLSDKSLSNVGRYIDTAILEPLCSQSSDFIAHHHAVRVHQLYQDISFTLKSSNMFHNVQLSIYGSNLTNLTVTGSDVDLSLDIPGVQLRGGDEITTARRRKYAYSLKGLLERSSRRGVFFSNIQAIYWARIPVVKGCYHYNDTTGNGTINFDVCFNNHIAVANSQLIREYTELYHPDGNTAKVRHLMILVKMWIKKHDIGSAANGYLSSYSWINLVIFYLQCIGFVPNLQCKRLIKQHIATASSDEHYKTTYNFNNNVAELNTCFLRASAVRNAGIWKQPSELQDLSVFGLMVT